MNSITVSGSTIEELKTNISKMAALLHSGAEVIQESKIASPMTDASLEAEPPKPKIVKAKKEKTEEKVEAKKAPEGTKEGAIKALQAVNVQKGIEVAREILTQFGAKRLTDMAPEKFGEFIAACEARLA